MPKSIKRAFPTDLEGSSRAPSESAPMRKCERNLRSLLCKPTLSLFINNSQTYAHSYLRPTLDNGFNGRAAVSHYTPLCERHPGTAIPIVLWMRWRNGRLPKTASTWCLKQHPRQKRKEKKSLTDCNVYNFGCFAHPLQLCIHDAIFKQKSV